MTGALGGLVRFQARVSSALAWKVTATRRPRAAACGGCRQRTDRRLHLGRIARHRGAGASWRIEVAGATPVFGHVREAGGGRRRAIRHHGTRRRPGDDQPERRRPGRFGHDHLLDERTWDRHRDAARCKRRRRARTLGTPGKLAAGEHSLLVRRARAAGRGLHDRRHRGRCGGCDRRGPADDRRHPNAGGSSAPAVVADAERRRQRQRADRHVPARSAGGRCVSGAPRRDKWVATPYVGSLPAGPQSLGWNSTSGSAARSTGPTLPMLDGHRRGRHRDGRRCPFPLDATSARRCKLAARPLRLWVSRGGAADASASTAPLRRLEAPEAGHRRRSPASRRCGSLVVVARDRGREPGPCFRVP